MPVWLSLLVCTAAGQCHVTVPVEEPYVGLAACQIDGMRQVPVWGAAHPGLYVASIRCSIGKKPQPEDRA